MIETLPVIDEFVICKNCGKHSKNVYCCNECAVNYLPCTNCGKYYALPNQTGDKCSIECTIIYKIEITDDPLYENFEE